MITFNNSKRTDFINLLLLIFSTLIFIYAISLLVLTKINIEKDINTNQKGIISLESINSKKNKINLYDLTINNIDGHRIDHKEIVLLNAM